MQGQSRPAYERTLIFVNDYAVTEEQAEFESNTEPGGKCDLSRVSYLKSRLLVDGDISCTGACTELYTETADSLLLFVKRRSIGSSRSPWSLHTNRIQ